MQNIYEILTKLGITVPEDKKAEFDKLMIDNYKTISEVNNIQTKLDKAEGERDTYKTKYDEDIKQRDSDIKDLQTKLKNAGTDADKLKTLETDLATLQTNYDTSKAEYEKKLSQQAYEFAIREKVSSIKFSSELAKKAFIADAMKEDMKLKNGELQGFDSFLESYRSNDAGAFIAENTQPDTQQKPTVQFSSKSGVPDTSTQSTQTEESPSVTFF